MFQQNVLQGPGTGTFTTHTFEILIMLLGAFLFGLWFGWVLWSRYRQAAEKLRLDNESLNGTVSALRIELDGLKVKLAESETDRSGLNAQVQNLSWENENYRSRFALLESDLAKLQDRNLQLETELGMSQRADAGDANEVPLEVTSALPNEAHEPLPDLEDAIANAIDDTFDAAHLDMPELEDAIADAVTAAIAEHTATSTPPPADIEPLDPQQETVIPAPLVVPEVVLTPEPEPVVVAVTGGPKDDLKIVEGIGPKIEELLFKAGVTTYGQLAATSVQQLKDILAEAGPRFAMHDPGTWSAQSLLAANGEWENLKAYQDFLNAGKRPDK